MNLNDDELIETVVELCKRGLSSQIILSVCMDSKLRYKKYGGHGIQVMNESIIPRLNESQSLSLEQRLYVLATFLKLKTWRAVCPLLSWAVREEEGTKKLCSICKY